MRSQGRYWVLVNTALIGACGGRAEQAVPRTTTFGGSGAGGVTDSTTTVELAGSLSRGGTGVIDAGSSGISATGGDSNHSGGVVDAGSSGIPATGGDSNHAEGASAGAVESGGSAATAGTAGATGVSSLAGSTGQTGINNTACPATDRVESMPLPCPTATLVCKYSRKTREMDCEYDHTCTAPGWHTQYACHSASPCPIVEPASLTQCSPEGLGCSYQSGNYTWNDDGDACMSGWSCVAGQWNLEWSGCVS